MRFKGENNQEYIEFENILDDFVVGLYLQTC